MAWFLTTIVTARVLYLSQIQFHCLIYYCRNRIGGCYCHLLNAILLFIEKIIMQNNVWYQYCYSYTTAVYSYIKMFIQYWIAVSHLVYLGWIMRLKSVPWNFLIPEKCSRQRFINYLWMSKIWQINLHNLWTTLKLSQLIILNIIKWK